MKRLMLAAALAALSISMLAASGLSFSPFCADPAYQESASDPYSFSSKLAMQFSIGQSSAPMGIKAIIKDKVTGQSSYQYLEYRSMTSNALAYLNMKGGFSMGLARLSLDTDTWFPKLSLEANVAGYLNTVFCGFEKNDALGYDGSYFIGASLKVADIIALRFGLHHFSGHYGDEMLEKFYARNNASFSSSGNTIEYNGTEYTLSGLVEYVRDNSYLLGASVNLPFGFRIYTEAELPKNPSWLRPFIHVPADYENPVATDTGHPTLIDRIGGNTADGEQVSQDQLDAEQALKRTSEGSYKAWRIHAGLEWSKIWTKIGILASCDVQMQQDGQTLHTIGGYSKTNPWELEVTASLSAVFPDCIGASSLKITAEYHDGRFPLLNYFYQRSRYASIGFQVF
jgi:hypothetical protein